MQIRVTQVSDLISPDLQARLKLASNRAGLHEAIGEAVISITKKAFNDAGLRPSVWANLANGQPSFLRKSGTLAKSVRVISSTEASVVLGSDRKYAAIHQLGGVIQMPARSAVLHFAKQKNSNRSLFSKVATATHAQKVGVGAHKVSIPARPYFPFYPDGSPTPVAHDAILQVIEKRLRP